MKRFKLGFLAVIAILAMSFTLADQKGAFKSPRASHTFCYTSVTVVNSDCTGTEAIDCSTSLPRFIANANTSSTIVCDDDGDIFCCAQLKAGDTDCSFAASGSANYVDIDTGSPISSSREVQVASIFCKLEP